jgi:hypothetical protein
MACDLLAGSGNPHPRGIVANSADTLADMFNALPQDVVALEVRP